MDSPIFQTKFARNMSIMCKLSYTELPREVILKVKIYPKRKAIEHKTYFLSQPIDVRTSPLLHLFIPIFCCTHRTSVHLHPSSAAVGVQSQDQCVPASKLCSSGGAVTIFCCTHRTSVYLQWGCSHRANQPSD